VLKRRKARGSLLSFIQYCKDDYVVSDFAVEVCGALEQFVDDMANEKRPLLVIQAPPQHGKTAIVSRYFPAWLFGKNPDVAVGAASYGSVLASDINRDVQRIMLSGEYRNLFPSTTLIKNENNKNEVEAKRNNMAFEIVNKKGYYISVGVGGSLTGRKVDCGIIDDPIKNAQEALSTITKDSIWNWYTTTFLTRLSANSGQIIMATSWATDDLSGRILEARPTAKHLKYKAISDDGRALIPERHSLEKLLEIKCVTSAHFWSAMYQQEPKVLGGNIIKGEYFKYYGIPPRINYRTIYADTAQKTKEHNDYSVFECWGAGDDGKVYLLDLIRGKWEAPELERRAVAFWNKQKSMTSSNVGRVRVMKVEDKVSGTGLIQSIRMNSEIPILGVERTKDKYTRLSDVLGYIESGYVCLPSNAPFLNDFVSECESFTANDKHLHDDQIDPMIDAINDLLVCNVKIEYKSTGKSISSGRMSNY